MPALLGVDACSLLHLKQLGAKTSRVLRLIDDLLAYGVQLTTTVAVHSEMLAMSLSANIDRWSLVGAWRTENVRSSERNELYNDIGKQRPMPGRRDIDLVALSRRLGAFLLTHDSPAAIAAKHVGVVTLDIVDICGFLQHRGEKTWDELECLLEPLFTFAWKPSDLSGSLEQTIGNRSWERMVARFDGWLGAVPVE